jgi:hypothetical protein
MSAGTSAVRVSPLTFNVIIAWAPRSNSGLARRFGVRAVRAYR